MTSLNSVCFCNNIQFGIYIAIATVTKKVATLLLLSTNNNNGLESLQNTSSTVNYINVRI